MEQWVKDAHVGHADAIADWAHQGQTDKAGRPYIAHVRRVAARVEGVIEKQVALLHDVLEDTTVGVRGLMELDIEEAVIERVVALTKLSTEKGEKGYARFIARLVIGGDRITLQVKLADVQDHLETPGMPEGLRVRYESALVMLTDALVV